MAHRTAAPSREVSPADVVAAAPEVLIICPCGIGLDEIERHLEPIRGQDWFNELPAVRSGRVALVDGNQMFSADPGRGWWRRSSGWWALSTAGLS